MVSSCPTGKHVYLTRKVAKKVSKGFKGSTVGRLRTYQCHECGMWHLTSWDAETTRIVKEYRKKMEGK